MAVSVSLKKLAEILGLAPSTVSRALKGHPDISLATQKKVKALAREMHYKPDALALSLRSKRSGSIAVVIPSLKDYFYACAVSSVIQYAFSREYKVMVFENEEDQQQEVKICYFLRKSGIDGLIVVPSKTTCDFQPFENLQNEGIPMVFLDRIGLNLDTDRVLTDDYYGAYEGVRHMISGGCRKIAHIAIPQQFVWAQKRRLGYEQALKDYGASHGETRIAVYDHLSDVEEITRQWLRDGLIDGIFAADDTSAIQAMKIIHEMNCRIPEDIAVCGFGNGPLALRAFPSLTTVNKDGGRAGVRAAQLLIHRLEAPAELPTETCLLKAEPVIRESTRPV